MFGSTLQPNKDSCLLGALVLPKAESRAVAGGGNRSFIPHTKKNYETQIPQQIFFDEKVSLRAKQADFQNDGLGPHNFTYARTVRTCNVI